MATIHRRCWPPGRSIRTIAVDATSVYWTTDDGVAKVPIAGGAPTLPEDRGPSPSTGRASTG